MAVAASGSSTTAQTLQQQRTFRYTGEGWGLTHDGTRLIMSDGSDSGTLRLIDPETLRQVGTLIVKDGGRPVPRARTSSNT